MNRNSNANLLVIGFVTLFIGWYVFDSDGAAYWGMPIDSWVGAVFSMFGAAIMLAAILMRRKK